MHEHGHPEKALAPHPLDQLTTQLFLQIEMSLAVVAGDVAFDQDVPLTVVILRGHRYASRTELAGDALVGVLDLGPEAVALDEGAGGAVAREQAAQPPARRGDAVGRGVDGALQRGAGAATRRLRASELFRGGVRERGHSSPPNEV